MLKGILKQAADALGYRIERKTTPQASGRVSMYDHDEMALYNTSLDFMEKERFARAYNRGMNSGHRFSKMFGYPTLDIHLEFRIHTTLWAASHALRLDGDFVECGVATGMFSIAVCDYLDFNKTGKTFWLFDTFEGHPDAQKDQREVGAFTPDVIAAYQDHFEITKKNFAEWPKARLVRGIVPDTLTTVPIDKVCYLSIDMNLWKPEVAALEYFWPKLVSGAVVILDDYGRAQFPLLREKEDEFAAAHGVEILTNPNGQGILLKP